jgi:molybdate transport system ATP-binding protein
LSIEAALRIERGDFRLEVDLALPGEGISAIFGPSGCGKTTLLRAIAGLDRDVEGRLSINGETWQSENGQLPPHRRPLGFVFQEASLFTHRNVLGNLEYGRRRVPVSQRLVSLDDVITLLDIAGLLDRRPNELSGGERQRVAIARALATSPRLLLMDEPLSALDQARKNEIMPYLESLHSELAIPILYVSHAIDEVARLADHLVLLDAGQVRASGDAFELFAQTDLPLAHDDHAAALIAAKVIDHDDDFALTVLDFGGGRFLVPRRQLPAGTRVRLRVIARDVSLTLDRPQRSSILNIIPATVAEIAGEGPSQVIVRLEAGSTPILARITRKSASLLALRPGLPVFAQVKSVAILD